MAHKECQMSQHFSFKLISLCNYTLFLIFQFICIKSHLVLFCICWIKVPTITWCCFPCRYLQAEDYQG